MAVKKDLIVYKPNELIEIINRPVLATGLKVYNCILQKLQDLETDRMTIALNDIIIDGSKNYEDIYSYLDELQKVQVKSIDKRGKLWGSFVLISEYKKVDGGVFVAVPPSIYNVLCGKDKKQKDLYYTAIKLLEEKSFKCSYSIIFYEIFKKYEKVSIPEYTLEELKQMTKTEGKYKVYYEFKRWVLNPAIKEINSFDTRYIYSFSEEYLGRRVYKIRFSRKEKPQAVSEAQQKILPELSEKLVKAIEKACKNRFIQEKYSQRAVDKAVEQFGEDLTVKALKELYKFQKPINSFSKILTAKIDDLRKLEAVKNTGIKHQDEVKNGVKTEITGSNFPETKEKTLEDYQAMVSTQSIDLISSFNAGKKVKFYKELSSTKNLDELKNFCDKYGILLNLELF